MEERKVYLVSTGHYSDYSIDAVFDTRELAEMYVRTYPGNGKWDVPEIEEYDLNPHEPTIRLGLVAHRIVMGRDGTTNHIETASRGGHPDEPETFISGPWKGLGRDEPATLVVHVLARNEQHAVKIANERRVQMIAMNEWPEDTE
jgi:hypothetical protein